MGPTDGSPCRSEVATHWFLRGLTQQLQAECAPADQMQEGLEGGMKTDQGKQNQKPGALGSQISH